MLRRARPVMTLIKLVITGELIRFELWPRQRLLRYLADGAANQPRLTRQQSPQDRLLLSCQASVGHAQD